MNLERWNRLQALVESAAELDPGTQTAWLEQTCEGDEELKEQAHRLLAVYTDDDTGLERAVVGSVQAAVQRSAVEVIQSGHSFGSYTVVRWLASGGMGSVYLAERRDEHFREDVAIKVVHASDRLRSSVLRRFRQERQVLAAIRHPNIASLLDGGITASGQPYLVMEYIDGEHLLRYVQSHRLTEDAILEIFRTICAAVQHAHQNLVVHRDLKPGNVMVTREGQPKLLDFGIAKLLSGTVAPLSAEQTAAADRLLTLQYASPEQITGGVITTATDIYGLGAMLYELLTGAPPFHVDLASLAEAQKLICETSPVPPSSRLLNQSTSRERRPRLQKANDLDQIVLKALHKSPERRYSSAFEFSEDIQRYLGGFPVRARPDSLAYRVRRFVGRHTGAVVFVFFATATVLVLLVLLTVQTGRARREAASADAVAAYLTGLFDQAQPDETHGRNVSARELLDHGTAQLKATWKGEPLVKARLLSALGRIYYRLGVPTEADALLSQAASLYASHRDADPAQVRDNLTTIGSNALERGDLATAEQHYQLALALAVRTDGRESEAAAELLDDLGQVQVQRGEYNSAARNLQQAAEIHARLQGAGSPDTLADKHNLESVFASMGQYHRAELLLREVMEADRSSHTSDAKTLTASDIGNLAYLLDRQGRLSESAPLLLQAVEATRSLFGEKHPRMVLPLLQLGWYQREIGELDQAEQTTRTALQVAGKAEGKMSNRTAYAEDYLGLVLLERGAFDQARKLFESAGETRRNKLHSAPSLLAQSIDHVGLVDIAQGDANRALAAFQQALEMRQKAFREQNDWVAISHLHCAAAELVLGQVDRAQQDLAEADRILQQSFGAADHPLRVELLLQRSQLASKRGDAAGAKQLLGEASAMARRLHTPLRAEWLAPPP